MLPDLRTIRPRLAAITEATDPYLRVDDEYRATTRETIIRGLAGAITYTPSAITVELQQPDEPRVAAALSLLLQEINATPPSMPGDQRPITYRFAQPPGFNPFP